MSQQLKEGTILQGGKYRIVSILGQGGFGITYKAVIQSSVSGNLGGLSVDVPITVKEFFIKDLCMRDEDTSFVSVPSKGSQIQVEQYRQKFVKEAHNIASLNHPNIVKVLDVFQENGTDYYAMQYLTGGSLRDYMNDYGAMPEGQALQYVMQIGDALQYMHTSRHLCHLDVKPGNILLEKGNAMLIDFGISKNYDAQGNETSSTPVGISDGYAPLEQYHNSLRGFSPESDVYSLGATLLALLTGQTPPDANTVNEYGLGIRPNYISEQTWAAIVAAMQPRRRDRPKTVAAFLDLLHNGGASVASQFVDNGITASADEATVAADSRQPKINEGTVAVNHVPPRMPKSAGPAYVQEPPAPRSGQKSGSWLVIIAVLAVLLMILAAFVFYNLNGNSADDSFQNEYEDEVALVDTTAVDEEAAVDTAALVSETYTDDDDSYTSASSGSPEMEFFEQWGVGSYDYSKTLFTDSRIAGRIRNLVGDTYFNYMQTHNDVIEPLTKTVSGSSTVYSGSGGMAHAAPWGYTFEFEEYGSGANSLRITITDEDNQQHTFAD